MLFRESATMPIYEYRCGECGAHTELLQRISDAPLTVCPQCGKPALTKLVSAAGFQLKGTGWYVTDFRDKGAKPAAKSDSKSDKSDKSEKSADKSADKSSKPADSAKPAESSAKESPKASPAPPPPKATTE
jgi:putative FmdB family regulatory protein